MKKSCFAFTVVTLLFVCGCDPFVGPSLSDVNVKVNASDLRKAVAGKLGQAHVVWVRKFSVDYVGNTSVYSSSEIEEAVNEYRARVAHLLGNRATLKFNESTNLAVVSVSNLTAVEKEIAMNMPENADVFNPTNNPTKKPTDEIAPRKHTPKIVINNPTKKPTDGIADIDFGPDYCKLPVIFRELVCHFDIPVGTEDVLANAPRSLLWLKYSPEDKLFKLNYNLECFAEFYAALTNNLQCADAVALEGGTIKTQNVVAVAIEPTKKKLSYLGILEFLGRDNKEYDKFFFSDYRSQSETFKPHTIKVVDDEIAVIGVAAVKVNGKKIISGPCSTAVGELEISYDNNFYKDALPCFLWGGIQTINANR